MTFALLGPCQILWRAIWQGKNESDIHGTHFVPKTVRQDIRNLSSDCNLFQKEHLRCDKFIKSISTTIYKISILIRGRSERFSRLPSFRQWIYIWLIHLIPEKFFGHSLYIRSLVPAPIRSILRFFRKVFLGK